MHNKQTIDKVTVYCFYTFTPVFGYKNIVKGCMDSGLIQSTTRTKVKDLPLVCKDTQYIIVLKFFILKLIVFIKYVSIFTIYK